MTMTFHCTICGEVTGLEEAQKEVTVAKAHGHWQTIALDKLRAENKKLLEIKALAQELSDRPSNLARTNLKAALAGDSGLKELERLSDIECEALRKWAALDGGDT
jgi:hypothetical protein